MYGIDKNGKQQSGWAFTDIDGSPTKSFIIENFEDAAIQPFFQWSVGLRPEFELFDTKKDPYCLSNLSGNPKYKKIEKVMKKELLRELKASNDTRIVGPDREVFDSYIRYSPMREFPDPRDQN